MIRCTECGHWNKEYDSEKIKCSHCGEYFATNNDTREFADEVIGICKGYKKARLPIEELVFALDEKLKDM